MREITAETINLAKAALSRPIPDELMKAWTQSSSAISGITYYDLEGPAKLLYPVLTPLRNETPRVSGRGGIQANWRGITGINTTFVSLGVGEGHRNASQVTATKDYYAAYRTIGLDDYVTFEAEMSAEGFDDLRALSAMNLLRGVMIGEERLLIGGQGTYALGQTPTPAGTPSQTSGTMTAAHSPYSVYCVALTLEGYKNALVTTIGTSGDGIKQLITRVNMGSTTDYINGGSAIVSAVYQPTITGGSSIGSVACTVAALPGAVAYAWFWGPSGGAVKFGAVTTVNAYTIKTDAATGSQNYNTLDIVNDFSQNSKVFDGLIAIANTTLSGSYIASLDNAPFTTDNYGGVTEINTMLRSFWENYRLAPDVIYCNSAEKDNIRKRILASATASAQRFVLTMEKGEITGGALRIQYYNPFTMTEEGEAVPIKIHPEVPQGTLLAVCHRLPYPLSNVSNVMQVRCRRDYYEQDWPMVNRQYEIGVYADQVFQHYFPPSLGLISNIQNA